MHTIRKTSGLAGFPKRDESIYDAFGAGHSSTSISAGLGMLLMNHVIPEFVFSTFVSRAFEKTKTLSHSLVRFLFCVSDFRKSERVLCSMKSGAKQVLHI